MLSGLLTKENAEIWRIAPYRFHAVVVDEWFKGRVGLVGDAAHQTPPFMGQVSEQSERARHTEDVGLICRFAHFRE